METNMNDFKAKARVSFCNIGCGAELLKIYVKEALSAPDKEKQVESLLKIYETAERIDKYNKEVNQLVNKL